MHQLPGVEAQAAQLAADLAARTGDLYRLLQSGHPQVCFPLELCKDEPACCQDLLAEPGLASFVRSSVRFAVAYYLFVWHMAPSSM